MASDADIRRSLGLPVADPPPQAQGAPPVPTQPVPAAPGQLGPELQAILDQNRILAGHVKTLQESNQSLQAALEDRKKEEPLPTDEELEQLPRTEATRKLIKAELDKYNRSLLSGLGKMARDLIEVREESEWNRVVARLPEQVRPAVVGMREAFVEKRRENPGLDAEEVFYLLARQHNTALAGAPGTTPRSQEGVPFSERPGAPATPSASVVPPGGAASEESLKRDIAAAHQRGDRAGAEHLVQQLVKLRSPMPADRR